MFISHFDKSGVDVEAKDVNGSTPLYWAASRGQLEVVKLLIHEAGADASTKNHHRSALHVSAGVLECTFILSCRYKQKTVGK